MLVEHLPGDPTSFHVLPFSDPRNQIKLTAKNRDQKRLWAQQIKQAMLEHFDIPSRAKELVFKLGDEEGNAVVFFYLLHSLNFFLKSDRSTDKHTWKWPHSSSTPEYLERRHQYRRSEFRYRSKKQASKKLTAKTASLERGRIKERRESFISYSRDELFEKDNLKKCEHSENCDCEEVKKELTEVVKGRSRSESRNPEVGEEEVGNANTVPMSPLEIKIYTSKTLPKRIEKIKKSREKKETAKFYTDLEDPKVDDENELKIVEPSDDATKPNDVQFLRRDSDIIKSILVQSELANRRLQKTGMPRRKSFEQADQGSPLSRRKLEEALEAIKIESQNITNESQQNVSQASGIEEPLYEELLRNVHVPYKFAPPMLKRSLSVSSASSNKDIKTPDKIQTSSSMTINDDDESEKDYVTLAYSDDKLESIDGVHVNSSKNSSSDDIKQAECKQPVKSFLHKFIKSPSHDEDAKSISMSSRKSFDGGLNSSWKSMIYKTSTTDIATVFNTPPIYRQGSEDLGSRIANVDYADPKKLFASQSNILINKSSLYQQRDSVVSSSTDSIIQQQQQQQQYNESFSDSYYEDTAESVLESKDFRDSAIYSDDSNEKRIDPAQCQDDHIYATVHKPPPSPIKPALPKKPSLLLKPNFISRPAIPPPIPSKPSNLKSPEVRNAIFNFRKTNAIGSEEKLNNGSGNSWVQQQVGKFQ